MPRTRDLFRSRKGDDPMKGHRSGDEGTVRPTGRKAEKPANRRTSHDRSKRFCRPKRQ